MTPLSQELNTLILQGQHHQWTRNFLLGLTSRISNLPPGLLLRTKVSAQKPLRNSTHPNENRHWGLQWTKIYAFFVPDFLFVCVFCFWYQGWIYDLMLVRQLLFGWAKYPSQAAAVFFKCDWIIAEKHPVKPLLLLPVLLSISELPDPGHLSGLFVQPAIWKVR